MTAVALERQLEAEGALAVAMPIRLLRLRLRNFKGIAEFTLDTQGRSVNVYGDNATGKTTLFDAFMWLLFDKDSENRKDFEIKTLGPDGQAIHGLEHEVEATLQIGGKPVTLRKVFREKWTKKRGSAAAEFTGHTADFYVDDVPVRKSEYDARIASIIREDAFRLLTDPTYFNEQLHWQERRRILLEVCGDVGDEDVIATNKALSRLPEILQGRKLDDHRKVIAARRAEINKELERIPVRIDEVRQGLPQVSDGDADELAQRIARLRAERDEKRGELARIQSGGEIAEKTRQLRQAEAELLQMESDYRRIMLAQIDEHEKTIRDARKRMHELEVTANPLLADVASLEREIDALRKKWHEVAAEEFTTSGLCPTCGQPLPEDQIEAARAAFNRRKAEELERISTLGKAKATELRQRQTDNEARQRQAAEARAELEELGRRVIEIQARIDSLRIATPDGAKVAEKRREVQAIRQAIESLKAGGAVETTAVQGDIARLDAAIADGERALAALEQGRRAQARIEELEAEERRLAAEFERLEHELYLTEEFIRTKVRLLEERINSCFKLARFKLFDTQINGGLTEVCETTFQGVPYSGGLNNGARISVGLDIINTLSEFYGCSAPIWIDNREAITKLPEIAGQVISLIVSENDKTLRVEVL